MAKKALQGSDSREPKHWYHSGKALAIAGGGVIAFLVSAAIPLYRNEVLPMVAPASLVEIKVKYNGDEAGDLWRNRRDNLVFGEITVGLVLRISNNSDFPLTVEDVLISTAERKYDISKEADWDGDYVYRSGVDTIYEALPVNVCKEPAVSEVSLFNQAVIGDGFDLARFRKITHVIPAHETDYVLIGIECFPGERLNIDRVHRLGVILELRSVFVIKGREFSVRAKSPVHVLPADLDFAMPNDKDSDAHTLQGGSVHSHHDFDEQELK